MKARLERLADALGRVFPATAISALADYCELVRTWNTRMDLTAARDDDALVEVLCADSMIVAHDRIVPPGSRIVDVGSGAGAPAIPLLILRPDARATLVEPLRKRVTFLRVALGALDLASRARVVAARLDDGSVVPEAPFDVAMSRATLAPAAWLALGVTLAPRVLVFTARDAPPETPDGWRSDPHGYALPSSAAPRTVTAYVRGDPSD